MVTSDLASGMPLEEKIDHSREARKFAKDHNGVDGGSDNSS